MATLQIKAMERKRLAGFGVTAMVGAIVAASFKQDSHNWVYISCIVLATLILGLQYTERRRVLSWAGMSVLCFASIGLFSGSALPALFCCGLFLAVLAVCRWEAISKVR